MMENALPNCPVETTLTLISDKWKVLILRDLLSGTKRFSELKRSIGGVSQKVLTAQLRHILFHCLLDGGQFSLSGGAAEGGVYLDGIGTQLEAGPGCHVGLGDAV